MVEMLGVLAVIGVLSVAALAGYNLAMNRHWANELLDEANKRAVSAMTQIDNGGNVTLGDFTDNVFRGGEFDTAVQVWNNEFGIRVNNVPEAVCQNLTKMTAGTISVAKVSEENGKGDITADDCEDENELYLVYQVAEGKTEEGCDVSKLECGDDQVANEKTCTCEACNEVCDKAGSDCRCNTSSAPSACSNNKCITCAAGETPKCPSGGDCICQKANESAACGANKCITCAADETPKCASWGSGTDACVCQKSTQSAACNGNRCITCAADETPKCSLYGPCVCQKANEKAGCGDYRCITCAADETPRCTGGLGTNACVCQKANESAVCGAKACISCAADKTPKCSFSGGCVCSSTTAPAACCENVCITCAADETPKCPVYGYGSECFCQKANESAACGTYRCIRCSSGTAQCNNGKDDNACQCVQ